MITEKQIILNQKLSSLPFSIELKTICAENNILTLYDLLEMEIHRWQEKAKGFNYHHQHEIVSFLSENNLLEFLKED
jgi:hypothetical protein